ncbi:MAG TPA: DUF2911 domain-containing protein [Blastocatellia bacterium]
MSTKFVISLVLALCFVVPAIGQGGARGTADATVGGKAVSITYGRPNWGGTDRMSQMPVGFVWRLGMNQATEINSAGTIVLEGGKTLPAGKYTLWVKRDGDNSWKLEFNSKTGIWGAPTPTDGFIAETPLNLTKGGATVEQLTIGLAAKGKDTAAVDIKWGTNELTGAFKVH